MSLHLPLTPTPFIELLQPSFFKEMFKSNAAYLKPHNFPCIQAPCTFPFAPSQVSGQPCLVSPVPPGPLCLASRDCDGGFPLCVILLASLCLQRQRVQFQCWIWAECFQDLERSVVSLLLALRWCAAHERQCRYHSLGCPRPVQRKAWSLWLEVEEKNKVRRGSYRDSWLVQQSQGAKIPPGLPRPLCEY